MLTKQRRSSYGAFHLNTAQALIFLIAAGCAYVVFNAYQQSHQPPPKLTLTGVAPGPDPKQARYAALVQAWQTKMAGRRIGVTWPYQGLDFATRVDIPGTEAIPANVLRLYLVYLVSRQAPSGNLPPGFTVVRTKADMDFLLQYLLSSDKTLNPGSLTVLRYYLQPGQGLNAAGLTDAGPLLNGGTQKSTNPDDFRLLRQCLQSKQPSSTVGLTTAGLPDRLSWGNVSQVLSGGTAQNLKDFYSTLVATDSYKGFVDVRTRARVANPASCLVHIFAPSEPLAGAADTVEEVARKSASGLVTSVGQNAGAGG